MKQLIYVTTAERFCIPFWHHQKYATIRALLDGNKAKTLLIGDFENLDLLLSYLGSGSTWKMKTEVALGGFPPTLQTCQGS